MKSLTAQTVVFMFSGLMLASCDESLPARKNIDHLFTSTITSSFYRENGTNYIRLLYTVKNYSDETIQENAVLNGSMEVTWIPSRPEESPTGINMTRSFLFSKDHIFTSKGYDRTTGKLLMEPGDSIVFFVQWNLKTNDSTFLPSYWGTVNDNQCSVLYANGFTGSRRITLRQRFSISGQVKLFDKLAILFSPPSMVEQCYVAPFVQEVNPPTSPCVNVNIINPCTIIGQ